MTDSLKTYYVHHNKDGLYIVYIVVYGSELDYHHVASFWYKEDMEKFTGGDYYT